MRKEFAYLLLTYVKLDKCSTVYNQFSLIELLYNHMKHNAKRN